MPAATATQWLTAAAVSAGLYLPGALLILALDHDLLLPLALARAAAQRARQQLATAARSHQKGLTR
ncbi:hypothetical protein ACFCYB_00500 [Streptomyces sp. NPDC056309]|uniref:hypothetical protein n=1 Tax=Streptomyces sp. NPDC056309 TaxID=3345781 RepID=UPI0035E33A1C